MNADRKRIQTTLVREWKERWQREVNRSRARHRGRAAAEEPADEPPTKERLKLHDGLQKAESSLLASPDENRQDRTPSLPVRTSGAGCDDSSLFMWNRWPGNSVACGSIYCQLGETTRRELPFARDSCRSRYARTEASRWR